MSGAYVPYHLRQNKAVDRQLFVDLLTKLNRYRAIGEFDYISFGGPYLEDFKLVHTHFGNHNLTSIENDRIAYARQKFNLPLSCIKALQKDSSDFVDEYQSINNSIIWLDFAGASETRAQIQQFQALLTKLRQHDVLKITLNSNPQSLYKSGQKNTDGQRETAEFVNNKRLEKLTHRLGDFMPQGVSAEEMTTEGLPCILSRALEYSANQALEGRRLENLYFQPLTSYAYSDSSHQMLTLAGILLSRAEKVIFFRETQIKKWKLATPEWGSYQEIQVPALTAREKIFMDQFLPMKSSREIHKKLKFQFDSSPEKSLAIVENYKKFYRYYPNFHRVVL